jgi:hypothetical protein
LHRLLTLFIILTSTVCNECMAYLTSALLL